MSDILLSTMFEFIELIPDEKFELTFEDKPPLKVTAAHPLPTPPRPFSEKCGGQGACFRMRRYPCGECRLQIRQEIGKATKKCFGGVLGGPNK
eukprot:6275952-Amphidinium_carterae.1